MCRNNRYSDVLRAGRSEDPVPVEARSSAPNQTRPDQGSSQPPVQWVSSFFPTSKAAGVWRWLPTPSSAEVKERVQIHVYSPPLWAFMACSRVKVLTYSMVQSPSWEASWFAASQEFHRTSRNPKVHYRTHKHPPPVSILGQPNPAHRPISHLLEIHPNIIHPSTPRSPQWSLSLRFPHQDPIHPLSSPIRATCPSHLNIVPYYLINGRIFEKKILLKIKCVFWFSLLLFCLDFFHSKNGARYGNKCTYLCM